MYDFREKWEREKVRDYNKQSCSESKSESQSQPDSEQLKIKSFFKKKVFPKVGF